MLKKKKKCGEEGRHKRLTYRISAKNGEGIIQLYNIYFGSTNIIMDTSKDHQ